MGVELGGLSRQATVCTSCIFWVHAQLCMYVYRLYAGAGQGAGLKIQNVILTSKDIPDPPDLRPSVAVWKFRRPFPARLALTLSRLRLSPSLPPPQASRFQRYHIIMRPLLFLVSFQGYSHGTLLDSRCLPIHFFQDIYRVF